MERKIFRAAKNTSRPAGSSLNVLFFSSPAVEFGIVLCGKYLDLSSL